MRTRGLSASGFDPTEGRAMAAWAATPKGRDAELCLARVNSTSFEQGGNDRNFAERKVLLRFLPRQIALQDKLPIIPRFLAN